MSSEAVLIPFLVISLAAHIGCVLFLRLNNPDLHKTSRMGSFVSWLVRVLI